VFGIAQTINAANYVYFEAQDQLRQLKNWPQAFLVFNEELLNLHRGQGMELYWRDTLQPPSEADYLQMIANKTGGLFRLVLRLLQCESKCEYDIGPLVDMLGLMFQILDDYKNLKDDQVRDQSLHLEI
jgi:geranylgeranyl diphosphate synthase type 3